MSERLFFALWPGDAQRLALTRVQRDLGLPQSRLTHPADLHLTLVFLGQASPEQRHCAEMAADQVKCCPFEVNLNQVGSFPRARVIWCGTDGVVPPLAALVAALRTELATCGFTFDCRPYQPHATLARKAPPLVARPLIFPIPWPVNGFVLAYGQELPPPRYRVLRRWLFA